VELLGFPGRGEYTPILDDGVWKKTGYGLQPTPIPIRPGDALTGLYDSRLVSLDGRLLESSHSENETVLVLEAEDHVFTARVPLIEARKVLRSLENNSQLRLTGVCRIEVGDDWRAVPDWRAKSFHLLLRYPADVQVLSLPPWWTLKRVLWALGIIIAAVLVYSALTAFLRRKLSQQREIIRSQLDSKSPAKS
jgi:hypothetical protein